MPQPEPILKQLLEKDLNVFRTNMNRWEGIDRKAAVWHDDVA